MLDNKLFLPHNFLGIPRIYSDYKRSKFVILPVPYEQTTTYKGGTREGPQAIISASKQVELFDEELYTEPYKVGIYTSDELESTSKGAEEMIEKIYKVGRSLLKDNKIIVMLGGEHTISIGMIKAFKEKYKDLSVLQLDAHADLRENYQENRFSHACTMRRVREFVPAIGVGIRNLSMEEHNWIKKNKINLFYAQKREKDWSDKVLSSLSDEVYLTFDLDFLDPSIMPSVGTPEPGGFLWYETLDFLKTLTLKKKIVGFDIVELCPQPGNVAPDFLTAKLIYKLIGYIVTENEKRKKEKRKNL
ncbi:MAG: agmatinase [candidate division Zixibacteria bacterium]|nr:agmatinase [candidate division Zixibacteria bacterium]